jgi:hypothetical protein
MLLEHLVVDPCDLVPCRLLLAGVLHVLLQAVMGHQLVHNNVRAVGPAGHHPSTTAAAQFNLQQTTQRAMGITGETRLKERAAAAACRKLLRKTFDTLLTHMC